MSIGNILIRPQVLERRPSDDDAYALDLFFGVTSRLAADFARGGTASQKVVAAIETEMQAFVSGFEPRLERTRAGLMVWLTPYLSSLQNLAALDIKNTDDLLPVVDKFIELAGKVLDDLHSDRLATRLNELADIVENDLGIGRNAFETLFETFFDRITETLARDFLAGSQTEDAVNHFALGRQLLTLRRLLRQLTARLPLPEFNRRALLLDLRLQLEASDWDEQLDRILEKITESRQKLTDLLPTLQDALSFGASRSGRRRASAEAGQLSWYASWFRDEGTVLDDRFNLAGEAFATDMKFDRIPLGFLEIWTHVTYLADEVARAILYGLQMENGNRVSPALNMGWQTGMGLTSLLSFLIDNKDWAGFLKTKTDSTFQTVVTQALTFAGAFEQLQGFNALLWGAWPHDRDNLSNGKKWSEKAYHGFLSLFTLINSDAEGPQKNHEKIKGFQQFGRMGGAHLGALMIGRTGWYYKIFSGNFGISLLAILIGGATTFACEVISWLLAGALARRLSDRYWRFESGTPENNDFENFVAGAKEFFGDKNAYGAFLFWSHLEFYNTWSSFWEGKTNNGKLGLKWIADANGNLERRDASFKGYPPKASSPYHLPFERGLTAFCSQAHLGFSSHNFHTGMIYAVDFMLNEGRTVLAMRGGIVHEYRDDLPSDSEAGKNYLIVRHDEPDYAHDRGENGRFTTTFAHYEVAQPFGIRRAFAAAGITPDRILGSRVQQGAPVMILGPRTGFFDFDYLQVWVSAAALEGSLPTIPFVFKDLPSDGVPQKGKYYGSPNTLEVGAYSKMHAPLCEGRIVESGIDFVRLEHNAPGNNNAFQNSHILIWYASPEGGTRYEYKKISAYNGGQRKATLEGGWSNAYPPPTGAFYRAGAKPHATADAFDKRFVFLAETVNNNAVDFPDGQPFGRLLKTGARQLPAAVGTLIGAGAKGSNEVHLDESAGDVEHSHNLRHIAIKRDHALLQYRRILDFRVDAGVRKIFIEGTWDIDLESGINPDTYEIGASAYFQAGANPRATFLSPDADPERYSPEKFHNSEEAYKHYPI